MCIAACNVQRINHSFAEAAATSAIKKYELNTPNQMSAEKQLELASKLSEATTASTRLTVENESLKAQIDKKDAEIQADKVTSYRSTSYELRVTSYELRVTAAQELHKSLHTRRHTRRHKSLHTRRHTRRAEG